MTDATAAASPMLSRWGAVPPDGDARLGWPRWGGGTYLPVGQHGGIVALEAALDELAHTGCVDLLLPGVQVKDKVIGEGLVLPQKYLGLPRGDRGTDVTALNLLL